MFLSYYIISVYHTISYVYHTMSYVCIILYHMCVEPDGAECWCAGAGVSSGSDASRDEQAPRDGRGTVLDSEVLLQFIFPGE